VGILLIGVIVFTVFLYCIFYVYLFLFVTSVRNKVDEWNSITAINNISNNNNTNDNKYTPQHFTQSRDTRVHYHDSMSVFVSSVSGTQIESFSPPYYVIIVSNTWNNEGTADIAPNIVWLTISRRTRCTQRVARIVDRRDAYGY
jgi:hypothetical protein